MLSLAVSLPRNGCPQRRPHDSNLQVGTKARSDGLNNKYQFPGCCALPVCFFHNCSCLCPTRPFLESPLSARPTTRTWRKRLGLQLPVEVPNNWRPAACRGRSCPREPRSHAHTFSACFSGLLPCPSTRPAIGRLAIGWCPAPLQGFAPCPHHRTAHRPRTRTALKSKGREKNRAAPPLCYPPPPPQQSRAAPESKSTLPSLRANLCPSSVFASRFQPSAPDLEPFFFLFPRNHADLQQSHRVSPRAKRKPQHPKPPSPAAACPRQWHHDGHAWRKPI